MTKSEQNRLLAWQVPISEETMALSGLPLAYVFGEQAQERFKSSHR